MTACPTCAWFRPLPDAGGDGTCRFHPPSPAPGFAFTPVAWPRVRADDWCREHFEPIHGDEV